MKTVLSIFGTRPEAIKMAPVIRQLERHADSFRSVVCVTAQHRQMLDQMLEPFGIRPDYDLDLMREEQDLFDLTAGALLGLKPVLREVLPDVVLVHGDTVTTLAASLAAHYQGALLGHVEAGLRSGNKRSPFPEEVCRCVAGVVADLHFAPTESARGNLLREGVPATSIHVTGNTVVDALLLTIARLDDQDFARQTVTALTRREPALGECVPRWASGVSRLVLVTGHRRENLGSGLANLCLALGDIAARHEDVEIVYPVHPNPAARGPVHRALAGRERVHVVEPLEYVQFIYLLRVASLVITDSGGVLEEAHALGKPALVVREATERPEALLAGTAHLVGTDRAMIVAEASQRLSDGGLRGDDERINGTFGDGHAAERIVDVIRTLAAG